jgi:hypothetical protein
MDLVTFWKNYGRDLESLMRKAHDREANRLCEVIKQPNHHLFAEEKYRLEDLGTLKMILSVVINMNRDEKIDSQR